MPETIADQLRAEQKEKQRRLQLQVAADLDYDPELAGRVTYASAMTELPTDVVAADLEGIEKQIKSDEFNYADYTDEVNGSPVFNKFAAEDPYNYAVLERDRKNLTRIERALDPIFMGWDSGWGMTELAEIVDRRMEGDLQEGDEERMAELSTLIEGGDFGASGLVQTALTWSANQAAIQGWILGESVDEVTYGMMAGSLYGAATGGTVGLGVGAVPGYVTGATVGAGAGLILGRTRAGYKLERALAYHEYSELGLNDSEARVAAEMVGVANAALESIGLGALTKRIPGFRNIQRNAADDVIRKIFNVPRFRDGVARFTLQYGEGMATEVVTEILQEVTLMVGKEHLKENAVAAGDTRPELMPMSEDEFWEQVKQITVQTMYGTSILGGIGPVMNLRADAGRAHAARQQQQQWKALGEAAEASSTRTEAKTSWDKFVERVQDEGPLEEIRIDADGFRKYFQSKEIDPAEAAKELGIDLSEAEATDVDLVVPFATYIDKIAPTEHHSGLMKDLRIREDEMTMRESENWYKEKDAHIESLEAAIATEMDRTDYDEMVDERKAELIAGGYNEKASDTQARLLTAMFVTTAQRQGLDPVALNQQRLAGIHKEVPVELAGGDIDMDVDPLIDRVRSQQYPTKREIHGKSLIDLIRESGGILDEGGELAGRDFGKQFPGVISKTGKSADALAELASEAGYITAYDEGQLMAAIDRELSGEQVFSRNAVVKEDLQKMADLMERTAEFFDTEGIDINNMSNAEVRTALEGIKTFDQSTKSDLDGWTRLLALSIGNDPTLMKQVWMKRPRVEEAQDFSSITFTDEFEITDPNDKNFGKKGKYTQNAQEAYDEAVNDSNSLKQLLDCVNG